MNTHSTPARTASPAPVQQKQEKSEGQDATLKTKPPMLFQARLSVGAPDDPYEQEAEKVSSQVMNNYEQVTALQRKLDVFGLQHSIQPMSIGTSISRKLQRTLFRTSLQKKCDECEKEEKEALHAKSDRIQFSGEEAVVPAQMESMIQNQRGGGQAMDPITQAAMESSFSADFSSVKIHTDSTAVQMSRDLHAHAFTIGNDIFFNEGRYQPHTKAGAGLLAHELTHVVQQGAAVQNKTVSRLPFSNLFSNNTIAKLSSAGGDAAQQARLYRKEIAQFQKEVPESKMQMQQQQILQSKEVDKVQTQSNAKIMRLYGGGGTPTSKDPIKMRKVISGNFEGGKKVSDHFPDLVGANHWGSDTTAGPFDNGERAGSVVQLIGEIPAGVPESEYKLKQMITVVSLKADGVSDPLEGTTLDDIARSRRDQSKPPFRQVFGNNVTMMDPISGVPYNTLKTYDFAANATTSIEHIATGVSKSVNWGVVVQAKNGAVTKNTLT